MERKVRTISVNGQKFVWWRKLSEEETRLNISPFADKTSVVSIIFPSPSEDSSSQSEWKFNEWEFNESVVMSKDGEEYNVKLIEPKMVGMILSYFTGLMGQDQVFITRKNIMINGFELLEQMGYQIIEVKKQWMWC